MSGVHVAAMSSLLRDHVLPLLEDLRAVVVDGGTDAGVMRVMGMATHETGLEVPLIGVAAAGTVLVPGRPAAADAADLEPHHTAFLLVPGDAWGDESPWLGAVASAIGGPSATLLVNGGDIAYEDAQHSVDAGRHVVVAAGTGRTADALAAALRGESVDRRAVTLARSGLVRAVDAADGVQLADMLRRLLTTR
jgi:hypothetical protein